AARRLAVTVPARRRLCRQNSARRQAGRHPSSPRTFTINGRGERVRSRSWPLFAASLATAISIAVLDIAARSRVPRAVTAHQLNQGIVDAAADHVPFCSSSRLQRLTNLTQNALRER